MRVGKWVGVLLAVYIAFVVLFEVVYLGMLQPSFEDSGIPMLVLHTTDESGATKSRMLANFQTDNKLYVSAHHWPRGWYRRAITNPDVQVSIDGIKADYRAVPVSGEEFDRVDAAHPLPLPVMFLMGFPPSRQILRLDPQATGSRVPELSIAP